MSSDMYTIRPGRAEDVNFILSTWLRSYKHASEFTRHVSNQIFYKYHEQLIKTILSRPGTRAFVACDKENPDVIFAWVVVETQTGFQRDTVIHFMYTKQSFRKFGIARALVAKCDLQNECEFTHLTFTAEKIIKGRPGLYYNPYRIA